MFLANPNIKTQNIKIKKDTGPIPAGCIDLTSAMPDFANWFKNNGKDLIIKVEY